MPYPPSHKDSVRARIVDAARRAFNRRGFEAASIEEIMADAGLTRGGFYRYFSSKADLYTEVMDCFFTNPDWQHRWQGVQIDPIKGELGAQIVRAYLSRDHLLEAEHACPMVAFPGDVARSGPLARQAYQTALAAMVARLQSDGGPERTTALAITALCIGDMVIARASEDLELADEVREAAMATAFALGGWRS
jgi:TetR/AcrR family transcriptional repressor of nem operon